MQSHAKIQDKTITTRRRETLRITQNPLGLLPLSRTPRSLHWWCSTTAITRVAGRSWHSDNVQLKPGNINSHLGGIE
jgi:hypothetical protein